MVRENQLERNQKINDIDQQSFDPYSLILCSHLFFVRRLLQASYLNESFAELLMPLTGSSLNALDAPYFKSLEELDVWAATPKKPLDNVLKYSPRPLSPHSSGKLLVTHMSSSWRRY
jgi:hypothetical protein